jgi:hypothetical protein
MRSSDVGMAVMILVVGFLMGTLSTLAVYSTIMNNRLDAERVDARKALDQAEQERDEAQGRIQSYLQKQHDLEKAMEQGDDKEEDKPIGTLRAGDDKPDEAAADKGEDAPPVHIGDVARPGPEAEKKGDAKDEDAEKKAEREALPQPSPDGGDKGKK